MSTPYGLAVAMGLLDERHAMPSAAQEDVAILAVVDFACACVPELSRLAVEAALFSEFDFGSSVVARVRAKAV